MSSAGADHRFRLTLASWRGNMDPDTWIHFAVSPTPVQLCNRRFRPLFSRIVSSAVTPRLELKHQIHRIQCGARMVCQGWSSTGCLFPLHANRRYRRARLLPDDFSGPCSFCWAVLHSSDPMLTRKLRPRLLCHKLSLWTRSLGATVTRSSWRRLWTSA